MGSLFPHVFDRCLEEGVEGAGEERKVWRKEGRRTMRTPIQITEGVEMC